MTLRIAHFVQRYPPALGGSEVYFQRLSRYLVTLGHQIDVWTTTALDLPAFWSRQGQTLPPGESCDQGVRVRRFACDYWPGRRFLLKAASLLPLGSTWRLLTLPCNPISLSMRRAIRARAFDYDIVHASAFSLRLAHCLRSRFGPPVRCRLLSHAVSAFRRSRQPAGRDAATLSRPALC
jgi:glycosyltransferase involved in cell wall biosynthesis